MRYARAYLTSRYATGVHEVLWEARERPMPDGDAVDAVLTASDHSRRGAGEPLGLMDVAAALVVLSAIRLGLDRAEARLLDTAQSSGMNVEQIAAILDRSTEEAGEHHRSIKARPDEPAAG
ncbi:hypothetical protein ACA361_41645 [Actinomadura sp. 21ATH]